MAVTFQKLIKHRSERLCRGHKNMALEHEEEAVVGCEELERELFELGGE